MKKQENKRSADIKSKSNQFSPKIQDFSISSTNIIHWNPKGNSNKKAELMDQKAKEKPDVLCIQETMLSKQKNFNLKNYNGLFKEAHTNHRAYGGVAIFIHSTIPYQKLILNTPLQAIAARINMGRDVTINENLLTTLFHLIPKPVILKRDQQL